MGNAHIHLVYTSSKTKNYQRPLPPRRWEEDKGSLNTLPVSAPEDKLAGIQYFVPAWRKMDIVQHCYLEINTVPIQPC